MPSLGGIVASRLKLRERPPDIVARLMSARTADTGCQPNWARKLLAKLGALPTVDKRASIQSLHWVAAELRRELTVDRAVEVQAVRLKGPEPPGGPPPGLPARPSSAPSSTLNLPLTAKARPRPPEGSVGRAKGFIGTAAAYGRARDSLDSPSPLAEQRRRRKRSAPCREAEADESAEAEDEDEEQRRRSRSPEPRMRRR